MVYAVPGLSGRLGCAKAGSLTRRKCTVCGQLYQYDPTCWPEQCRDWCRMQALGLAPPHDSPDAHRELRASGEYDRRLASVLRDMPAARAELIQEGVAWWLE